MRLLCLALVTTGCMESSDEPLSRLTRAWAVETAEVASPAVTATTLLAGLAAALCTQRESPDFLQLQAGDALPLGTTLGAGLGDPVIHELSTESSLQMVLSGVDVLDRDDQWLRITGTDDGGQLSVELDALLDDGSDDVDVAKLAVFGQMRFDVDGACQPAQALIRGKALWIDESERRHDIQLPADSELGGDLSVGGEVPYLPQAGALGWSARVEGQERSITTEDAAEIRMDSDGEDVPGGRWPVVARGPGWSGTAITEIAP